MVRLASPSGVEVDASDEAVANLLAIGFKPLEQEKPKPAPRKRPAKQKE